MWTERKLPCVSLFVIQKRNDACHMVCLYRIQIDYKYWKNCIPCHPIITLTPCPNFGYLPVKLISLFSWKKIDNNCEWTVSFWIFSAFKWGFLFVACLQHVQTLCLVRNSNDPRLGHGVEVRACYPIMLHSLYPGMNSPSWSLCKLWFQSLFASERIILKSGQIISTSFPPGGALTGSRKFSRNFVSFYVKEKKISRNVVKFVVSNFKYF